MLTRWLTFIAFLAGSANLGRAASGWSSVTTAPSCRVKGEPEGELILGCGDGKDAGSVQFWHTPFGDLQTSALYNKLGPAFLHHDGSLVIPNCSVHHSGVYYCVLHHMEGSTLWPYELHVGHYNQNNDDKSEQDNSCPAHRFRRNVRLRKENRNTVSDGLLLKAVVASVLLTFVVGFSAGALTRTYVLRCLRAITTRLQSPRQRRRHTDTTDHSSQVTMATLPPMYDNQSFEAEEMDNSSPTCRTMERSISVTSSSPPAKPKRSFRQKREEKPGTTAYLEGCDYMQEEKMEREEVTEGTDEEANEENETTKSSFYLSQDEGNQHETDEDKRGEDREKDGEESSEERMDWGLEKVEAGGEQENRSKEVRREEKEVEQITEEVKESEKCQLEQPSTETEDKETSENEMRNVTTEEKTSSSAPRRGSRVIRLYQYNEDGERYSHLPEHGPEDPEPAPRLKQRSLSLTRLNAIMAAASAGPMDSKEPGEEQSEERPQLFHMEI